MASELLEDPIPQKKKPKKKPEPTPLAEQPFQVIVAELKELAFKVAELRHGLEYRTIAQACERIASLTLDVRLDPLYALDEGIKEIRAELEAAEDELSKQAALTDLAYQKHLALSVGGGTEDEDHVPVKFGLNYEDHLGLRRSRRIREKMTGNPSKPKRKVFR